MIVCNDLQDAGGERHSSVAFFSFPRDEIGSRLNDSVLAKTNVKKRSRRVSFLIWPVGLVLVRDVQLHRCSYTFDVATGTPAQVAPHLEISHSLYSPISPEIAVESPFAEKVLSTFQFTPTVLCQTPDSCDDIDIIIPHPRIY